MSWSSAWVLAFVGWGSPFDCLFSRISRLSSCWLIWRTTFRRCGAQLFMRCHSCRGCPGFLLIFLHSMIHFFWLKFIVLEFCGRLILALADDSRNFTTFWMVRNVLNLYLAVIFLLGDAFSHSFFDLNSFQSFICWMISPVLVSTSSLWECWSCRPMLGSRWLCWSFSLVTCCARLLVFIL